MNVLPRTLSLLALCLVLAATGVASAQRGETRIIDIEVDIGHKTSISARDVRSYSKGVAGVAAMRLTDDQTRFVIVGQRAGVTSLLLILNDGSQAQYRITVRGGEPEHVPPGRVRLEQLAWEVAGVVKGSLRPCKRAVVQA